MSKAKVAIAIMALAILVAAAFVIFVSNGKKEERPMAAPLQDKDISPSPF